MLSRFVLPLAAFAALTTGAFAADLMPEPPAPAPPPPLPVFSWTGVYIGANLGGTWATTSGSVVEAPLAAIAFPGSTLPLGSLTAGTFMGGGQIGYNWQTGPFVFGLEGDADGQRWAMRRTQTTIFGPAGFAAFVPGDSFSVTSNWQASIRGRIGYAWDRFLLYATGGVAFTGVDIGNSFVLFGGAPATATTTSETFVGGTIGGGLEYAFTDHVTIGVEGRYNWYGSRSVSNGVVDFTPPPTLNPVGVTQNISLQTGEVMAKLNYKF